MHSFRHVLNLWDDQKEASLNEDQLALFLYRSNLLGSDLRITNYGGGNTSCKIMQSDPLTGKSVEVMWIKGSGGDIGTLTRKGIAGLYTSKIHDLKNIYKGLPFEDEIVPLLQHCLYDLNSAAPSIDTPLHGLLPFPHIDHLHPDMLIAIAAAENGESIMKEIWGDKLAWIPWQRPGFDLGLQLEKCYKENPNIKGIILGSHGLFTWGNTSRECYFNSLNVIEEASIFLEKAQDKKGHIFGGIKIESPDTSKRHHQATQLMPILRGLCSEKNQMIGHFSDDPVVLSFINSHDLDRLAPLGTSCPDHFLRTKIKPLVLSLGVNDDLSNSSTTKQSLLPAFEQYRAEYAAYYLECKHVDSPAMRDPNPVVIIYPGIGLFTFAKDKQTARVAAEFYQNAIQVMRGAEAVSSYTALPRQEAFNIEYWLLEEAKLQRMPPEKPLSRRIALITGGGGGIGGAIAKKLAAEGAHIVITDLSEERLTTAISTYNKDSARYFAADITKEAEIEKLIDFTCLQFGGLDIIVHSAGLAISKSLTETLESDWDILQNVLVKAQFQLYKLGVNILKKQNLGGNLIAIASKNGLVSGPNNVAYGTAKAAQQHMTRLLAAELAKENIRVNTVNPDGVIVGSKIWEGEWAEGRAKAYGIAVSDLPAHYAKRNLLGQIILPEDIANGVYALLAILNKSTGITLNVDGGIPEAFVR
jgi:rhamnulose-1-phosphate aldolase/alcohol dehydrogenase